MTQSSLANAADYADALLAARRAKSVVTLILLLVLLVELSLFFCLRYYKPLHPPAGASDQSSHDAIQYLVGLMDFAGLIVPAILAVILFLILQVQLVGRLVGTGLTTSAFLWSILLLLLLFPWQAVLNNPAINYDPVANSLGMKIPGVIYTWAELSNPTLGAGFDSKSDTGMLILHWARYAGFPILSILILTVIHLKSHRGLRQSLGEDQVVVATTPSV